MLNAKVGDIVKVWAYRDNESPTVSIGEVVEVRDTHKLPISKKARKRKTITRSQYLITLKASGEVYRSYYHHFIFGRKLSTWERLYGWLTGKL
jgi:hypothetical protein